MYWSRAHSSCACETAILVSAADALIFSLRALFSWDRASIVFSSAATLPPGENEITIWQIRIMMVARETGGGREAGYRAGVVEGRGGHTGAVKVDGHTLSNDALRAVPGRARAS